MPGVHQLVARLSSGDAMGNHAIALQRLFASWGFSSRIFASYPPPDTSSRCQQAGSLEDTLGPDDIVVLHYGAYAPDLELFSRTRARKVLAYHNVTPPSFFLHHAARHYYETALGRLELPKAVSSARQCWTESAYNKRELDVLGATDCRVVPLLLQLDELDRITPDARVLSRYDDGATNLVFVGRLVPNKRQDNLITAFACYRRESGRRARLLLVGRSDEVSSYHAELRAHARHLAVDDAVVFTGHVTREELVAYYRVAAAFVCMSEHEGFAVPLVEAMHLGVPVVALARAAVPETLGGAGVVVDEPDFGVIAGAIDRVCFDAPYREHVIAAQHRRIEAFAPERVAVTLRECVTELQR